MYIKLYIFVFYFAYVTICLSNKNAVLQILILIFNTTVFRWLLNISLYLHIYVHTVFIY